MTGRGAEINFGGHEKFILCELERGTGAREIYPTLDQMNKVRSKDSKKFSGRNRKFKRFFSGQKLVISKKKRSSSQNTSRNPVSVNKKHPNWASICTPEAPSLLISSGENPRLGGHNFRSGGAQAISWGGTAPVSPPWRRV